MLGKPVAQLTLMSAVIRLKTTDQADGSKLSWETVLNRINEVDWNSDNPLWQRILMNGTRVVSGRQAVNFASRFIAYYLGEPLEEIELGNLGDVYFSHFPDSERASLELPERLFEC